MGAQSRAIGEQLRRHIEQIFKALVLEIDRELRKSTPVDTGHARANWVPSVGAPHSGVVETVRVAGNVGSSAHAAGVSRVLSFKLGDGVLWISNSVPYIQALNYGHSDQAPRLFIEQAIDRAVATINARYAGSINIDRVDVLGSTRGGQELLGGEIAEGIAGSYNPLGDFQ